MVVPEQINRVTLRRLKLELVPDGSRCRWPRCPSKKIDKVRDDPEPLSTVAYIEKINLQRSCQYMFKFLIVILAYLLNR